MLDYMFSGFCKLCTRADFCFENSICLRRCLSPEYDDDPNVSEETDVEDNISGLTEEATYFIHDNRTDTDKQSRTEGPDN